MDIKKLDSWAEQLLDTGKRNNLVNFKDTKSSSVEVVLPEISSIFEKADSSASFEVFDPKLDTDEDDVEDSVQLAIEDNDFVSGSKRSEYIRTYSPKIRKASQILLYNASCNPLVALKNIHKKAKTAIEETGVNVAYMAFGFIRWKENDHSQYEYNAPILLAPVLFENESSIEPYHIKMTEDDVIVNPTFNYKLQSEYGVKLPEYEDESFDEYMDKVSDIVTKLGWSCSKVCKIGIFSFLKINMYNDIKENAETILKNENVRKLLGEPVDLDKDSNDGNAFDIKNELVELHNVVDADSSQIEAIEMTKAGTSFVLQGPPGTGKSQTITNIIAECLSDGKKVLFVSEKLAALNVVYEKLKQAGLAEFCLELHSHKANKKDVIAELCHTLRATKSAVSSKAQAEISAKVTAQRQLDQYAEELHKLRPVINKTLYQLYNSYSAYRTIRDIDYVIDTIETKGEDYINSLRTLLEQYVDYIPSIGYNYRNNVWFGCCVQDSSYQSKASLKTNLTETIEAISILESLSKRLHENFDITADSVEELHFYRDFLGFLGDSDFITPSLLSPSAYRYANDKVSKMIPLAKEAVTYRDGLLAEYDADLLKLDGNDYHKRLTKQFSGAFSRLFNGEYKKIISEMRLCKKNGKKPKYDEAVKACEALAAYQQRYNDFSSLETDIKTGFGRAYNGVDTDWDNLLSQMQYLGICLDHTNSFGNIPTLSTDEFIAKKDLMISMSKEIASVPNSSALNTTINSFDPYFFDFASTSLTIAKDKCTNCLANFDTLDNWCRFNALLSQLKTFNAIAFINMAIDNNVEEDKIVDTYCKAFYRQHIDHIIFSNPVLASFARISQDKAVEIFSKKDELQFEISKAQIKAELSARRPSLDMIASGSAVSILLREGEKKRKQKGIRTLFAETGELVQILKPCFLMSPLSVSTFLSSADIHFDVVVFDEASQIFPQDAVGAIYRGKQLIVVGDSKQMPPSNFFNATVDSDDDDEESGDVKDFESILDMCSTTLPQLRLKWHYRSRYEQLISFSNKNFYDNDLVTFPSSKTDKNWIGVDYHYVDGIFDHTSKSNMKEAEYIVDLIYENFEKYPERSLGVVAFSISQQNLIDKLLSKRRQLNPAKESFFRSDRKEPFFIKNLETVQGDERDTIIFSIGYAKDSQGRLMHNFGPLNRVGGERRLNVAVTRAKMNVQLVSSMHHTDIDLNRTKAEGARLLREYLDYAENGIEALERSLSVNPFEQYDSEFEMEVCDFLRSNGFSVDTQVGCSSFRIDLALKLPNSSDYVLAIECDGASYHSSKNARDRDRLRQSILERMGWKFYRIWSTDWFKNNQVEKEKLLAAATEAVNNPSKKAKADTTLNEPSFEEVAQEKHFEFPKYEEADIIEAERFFPWDVQGMVKEILQTEAPMSEEWLLKRIVYMYEREKVTSVVIKEFEEQMRGCSRKGIIRRDKFLYLADQKEIQFRVPNPRGIVREIKYISLEELSVGMYEIIKQNISVDKDGLFLTITKLLGFNKTGKAIYERFEAALQLLRSVVDIDGNTISIKQ